MKELKKKLYFDPKNDDERESYIRSLIVRELKSRDGQLRNSFEAALRFYSVSIDRYVAGQKSENIDTVRQDGSQETIKVSLNQLDCSESVRTQESILAQSSTLNKLDFSFETFDDNFNLSGKYLALWNKKLFDIYNIDQELVKSRMNSSYTGIQAHKTFIDDDNQLISSSVNGMNVFWDQIYEGSYENSAYMFERTFMRKAEALALWGDTLDEEDIDEGGKKVNFVNYRDKGDYKNIFDLSSSMNGIYEAINDQESQALLEKAPAVVSMLCGSVAAKELDELIEVFTVQHKYLSEKYVFVGLKMVEWSEWQEDRDFKDKRYMWTIRQANLDPFFKVPLSNIGRSLDLEKAYNQLTNLEIMNFYNQIMFYGVYDNSLFPEGPPQAFTMQGVNGEDHPEWKNTAVQIIDKPSNTQIPESLRNSLSGKITNAQGSAKPLVGEFSSNYNSAAEVNTVFQSAMTIVSHQSEDEQTYFIPDLMYKLMMELLANDLQGATVSLIDDKNVANVLFNNNIKITDIDEDDNVLNYWVYQIPNEDGDLEEFFLDKKGVGVTPSLVTSFLNKKNEIASTGMLDLAGGESTDIEEEVTYGGYVLDNDHEEIKPENDWEAFMDDLTASFADSDFPICRIMCYEEFLLIKGRLVPKSIVRTKAENQQMIDLQLKLLPYLEMAATNPVANYLIKDIYRRKGEDFDVVANPDELEQYRQINQQIKMLQAQGQQGASGAGAVPKEAPGNQGVTAESLAAAMDPAVLAQQSPDQSNVMNPASVPGNEQQTVNPSGL